MKKTEIACDFIYEDAYAELIRRNSHDSFWYYRQYIHYPKMHKGWWQEEVARHLHQFYKDFQDGKRPKLIINCPPQHGKSEQVVDFLSWLSGMNPDLRTIYASFSDRLGIRANLKLQRLFDSVTYKRVFPDTVLGSGNSTFRALRTHGIIEFVGREGSFRNTTIKGQINGEGLDIGVIDDPIKGREEASSKTVRDKTWDWFTDDFFSRFSDSAGMIVIATRWHVDDPVGRMIDLFPDLKILKYPAIAVEDEELRDEGEPLFPELKSLDFLLERKEIMPLPHWEALYQQNPIVAEGELFKPVKIETIDAIPAGVTKWIRGWDLASTTDGDYTAGAKLGKLPDGRILIADMVRVRCGPDERDAALVNTASRDGKNVQISIPQDPGQAGRTQALYLTRALSGYGCATTTASRLRTRKPRRSSSSIRRWEISIRS